MQLKIKKVDRKSNAIFFEGKYLSGFTIQNS